MYQNVTRSKCNVVITGLPEADTEDAETDKEVDSMMFVKFCKENLSVKPALAPSGCVHLGKSDRVRPRRLLVHLTSETSAASLLLVSKALQQNDDTRNVYFNPDLRKIEAKLTYEKRVEKRRRRQDAAVNQTTVTDLSASNQRPHVSHQNQESSQNQVLQLPNVVRKSERNNRKESDNRTNRNSDNSDTYDTSVPTGGRTSLISDVCSDSWEMKVDI